MNGVVHTYYYSGGKLVRETYGSNVLDFFYDQNGHPFMLNCNGSIYYYIVNAQGDVVRLMNTGGYTAAWYQYDPYGNIIDSACADGVINPLRYRGYYYDDETSLYYLQSRYYDPVIGRFINADNQLVGGNLIGMNLFAYCNNNPVNYLDPGGTDPMALQCWTASMWWLCLIDGPIPIGDILYGLGVLLLGCITVDTIQESTTPNIYYEENNENETKSPEPPDVTYPGDDPSVAPGDDYEWRGKPDEPVGSDKGSWVNKKSGEQWHPDLNHKPPKGPHWDYTDPSGRKWYVPPNGEIKIW